MLERQRLPERRRPVHKPILLPLSGPVIVFLTANTRGRRDILATPEAVQVLIEAWQSAGAWMVGRFVVMPDHVHLFASPEHPEFTLEQWVRYWKSKASRRWPRQEELPLWQAGFWDTQVRRGESYDQKWQYVRENPVRKGWVTRPEDWPYAGELDVLAW